MKKNIVTLISTFYFYSFIFSQNIAINTNGQIGDSSSILDVYSDNKGVLIPRVYLLSIMDTLTIKSPANSLLVFNTNSSIIGGEGVGFYYFLKNPPNYVGWKTVANSKRNEWFYFGKLNYFNENNIKFFDSLPVHSKWMIRFSLKNNGITSSDRIVFSVRLNSISSDYQYIVHTNSGISGLTGKPDFSIVLQLSDGFNSIFGSAIFDGKHNNGVKKILVANSVSEIISDAITQNGHISFDNNDLTKIEIISFNNIIGYIEFYYQDE